MGYLTVLLFSLIVEWALISRIMNNQMVGAIISAVLGYAIAIGVWCYVTGQSIEEGALACFLGFLLALALQIFFAYRGIARRRAAEEGDLYK